MAAIGEAAFEAALRDLSAGEFARFVAALWAARGHETRREGAVVVVDGQTRLGVRHDARRLARLRALAGPPFRDVDAVVSSSRDPSSAPVRTIDAAALREMALYGLDREVCRRLFDRHLDAQPRVPDGAGGRSLPAAWAVGAVVAAVVAVLLVAGAGGVGPAATPADAGAGVPGTEPAAANATLSGVDGGGPPDLAAGGAVVNGSGVANATRLARAHTRAVRDRPRSWAISSRLTRNGTLLRYKTRTVRVHNATVYRSRTEWFSSPLTGSAFRGNASTYADGRRAFRRVREGNATIYRRLSVDRGPPQFAGQPASLVRRYLAVNRTRAVSVTTVDGSVAYRIVMHGRIHSNSTPANVTAVVTESGVVRRLDARYRIFAGRTIHVSFRLRALGNVTVTEPPWVERARASTAG